MSSLSAVFFTSKPQLNLEHPPFAFCMKSIWAVLISSSRLSSGQCRNRRAPASSLRRVQRNDGTGMSCPTTIDDPCHEPYLEAAERLGLPFVGLQADFSSYEYCVSSADIGMYTVGAEPPNSLTSSVTVSGGLFQWSTFIYDDIEPTIEKMKPNEVDRQFWLSTPVAGAACWHPMMYCGLCIQIGLHPRQVL